MPAFTLYLGNKNYSSWSLRAWLACRLAKIHMAEEVIPLRTPATREQILKVSPSGKVPVLTDHERKLTVWDSLSICEYLHERFPQAGLWPVDTQARAAARSVTNEMHSGFLPLRRAMPMNLRRTVKGVEINDEIMADITRICAIWMDCKRRFGGEGEFLFGAFTVADAFYAPVASRFVTYGVALDETPRAYVEAVMNAPDMKRWREEAGREPWMVPDFEVEDKS